MEWTKSSFCGTDHVTEQCIEVRGGGIHGEGPGVTIRDSKDPDGPRLFFTNEEFEAFLSGAKAGDFDHLI